MGLGSGIRKKPIPDPGSGVKKAPDPGARILIRNTDHYLAAMTPWQPVAAVTRDTSSRDLTSPFATTGISMLSLIREIMLRNLNLTPDVSARDRIK